MSQAATTGTRKSPIQPKLTIDRVSFSISASNFRYALCIFVFVFHWGRTWKSFPTEFGVSRANRKHINLRPPKKGTSMPLSSIRLKNTPDGSMLLEELLEMILARLDLVDHFRFGAVCKLWRSVAARTTAATKSFSLVCSDNPRRLISRLLSSKLLSPHWTPLSLDAQFIGSYEGWLVVKQMGWRGRVFLLNPALGAVIPLPPFPDNDNTFAGKAVLSASPSSGNCVIVLSERRYWLAYWRLGDTATGWTFFYQPRKIALSAVDMAFYKDRLYMIDMYGGIRVFDSGLNSNPTCTKFPRFRDGVNDSVGSLVNAFDKLLLIKRLPSSGYYKVFMLDPSNSSSNQLESIGDDNILLYSPICSVSLSSKDHKDLRPNHLYGHYPYPEETELVSYCLPRKTLTWESTSNVSLLFFTLFKDNSCFSIGL